MTVIGRAAARLVSSQPLSIALSRDFTKTYLYHITDVSNIPSIVANGGLLSDCALQAWRIRLLVIRISKSDG